MSWFEKLMPSRIRTEGGSKRAVPEGLWAKCTGCSAVLYRAEVERNLDVCPNANTTTESARAGVSISSSIPSLGTKSVKICRRPIR